MAGPLTEEETRGREAGEAREEESDPTARPLPPLSITMRTLRNAHRDGRPLTAAAIADELFAKHSDYATGPARPALGEAGPARPVQRWLERVADLFVFEGAEGESTPQPQAEFQGLDGRRVIIGLGLLESSLRTQLELDGRWAELLDKLRPPLEPTLSERGTFLFKLQRGELSGSVPNQSDEPLDTDADDRLGRAVFAQVLTQRIRTVPQKSGSYCIHVYGPWGSGKSTLLHFVKEDLRKENADQKTKTGRERWAIAEFNAWQQQHIPFPWWSLMDHVYRQTRKKLPGALACMRPGGGWELPASSRSSASWQPPSCSSRWPGTRAGPDQRPWAAVRHGRAARQGAEPADRSGCGLCDCDCHSASPDIRQ